MMTQVMDLHQVEQRARQIKSRVLTVLTKWGLLPRFKRWRLTQDPDTGMVVLFGVLNNQYIAAHTSIPFSNYFDPRLLHDLANDLQVQVVSCNSDGLRYAFILDRGQFGMLPTHIDYPFIDNGRLLARVVFSGKPEGVPDPPVDIAGIDDQTRVRQGVGAFLKVFDDIKLREDAAQSGTTQTVSDVVLIDEDEFKRRVAEHEAVRQRRMRISSLLDGRGE